MVQHTAHLMEHRVGRPRLPHPHLRHPLGLLRGERLVPRHRVERPVGEAREKDERAALARPDLQVRVRKVGAAALLGSAA